MNEPHALEQANQFLAQSGEFRLGALITEQPHPVTHQLSQTAETNIPDALGLLFQVDDDVFETYRKWITTGRYIQIKDTIIQAVTTGHKIFFTGCGATGRLSILLESIWREFWQKALHAGQKVQGLELAAESVMAGGDYALIKSVEGFEDFTQFGGKQIEDMGISEGDVVFAITEGGETSFVIGTAWKGLEKGAKVYFVYCNTDEVLRQTVVRSREIIDDPRIEKVNLTTGPMAIMGSTRMQATSIQLLALLTVLEMVVRELCGESEYAGVSDFGSLDSLRASLVSDGLRTQLAELVELEAETYRTGHKSTYFANHFAIDVLTDTTERSPTFCTPAFRKWDDAQASESWSYLVLPYPDAESAWSGLLKRPPHGLAWTDHVIRNLVGVEKADRQSRIMRQIGPQEILKFRIGTDGLIHRPIIRGDLAVCVVFESEMDMLLSPEGFFRKQLEHAASSGASTAVIFLGREDSLRRVSEFLESWEIRAQSVLLTLPETHFYLDAISRVGVKMLLNALSTCVMVRLGRVQGNCMVAVVPSNLKLIDRSTRYVQTLTDLSYEESCRLLFESIEHVRERMQSGQSYPPPVELTVARFTRQCTLGEAEAAIS